MRLLVNCVYEYYEDDTNWWECRHPDYDEDWECPCEHHYDKQSAKDDAKYGSCDKY